MLCSSWRLLVQPTCAPFDPPWEAVCFFVYGASVQARAQKRLKGKRCSKAETVDVFQDVCGDRLKRVWRATFERVTESNHSFWRRDLIHAKYQISWWKAFTKDTSISFRRRLCSISIMSIAGCIFNYNSLKVKRTRDINGYKIRVYLFPFPKLKKKNNLITQGNNLSTYGAKYSH